MKNKISTMMKYKTIQKIQEYPALPEKRKTTKHRKKKIQFEKKGKENPHACIGPNFVDKEKKQIKPIMQTLG